MKHILMVSINVSMTLFLLSCEDKETKSKQREVENVEREITSPIENLERQVDKHKRSNAVLYLDQFLEIIDSEFSSWKLVEGGSDAGTTWREYSVTSNGKTWSILIYGQNERDAKPVPATADAFGLSNEWPPLRVSGYEVTQE